LLTAMFEQIHGLPGCRNDRTFKIATLTIYPKIIEEPHFECVRLRRTHSKCELLLNFRIGS